MGQQIGDPELRRDVDDLRGPVPVRHLLQGSLRTREILVVGSIHLAPPPLIGGSGGGPLLGRGRVGLFDSQTIDERDTFRDLRQQLGRVEPPEGCSAISSVFQVTAVAFSTFLYRLAAAVRSRTAANADSTGFVSGMKEAVPTRPSSRRRGELWCDHPGPGHLATRRLGAGVER
jgi:hypothetical protein